MADLSKHFARDMELSLRTANTVTIQMGRDTTLAQIDAMSDADLQQRALTRRSIKELREVIEYVKASPEPDTLPPAEFRRRVLSDVRFKLGELAAQHPDDEVLLAAYQAAIDVVQLWMEKS